MLQLDSFHLHIGLFQEMIRMKCITHSSELDCGIKLTNEIIPNQHCLFMSMRSYQYMGMMDLDEMIVPYNHSNWNELIQYMDSNSSDIIDSYGALRWYFLDRDLKETNVLKQIIPKYSHMMRHIYSFKQPQHKNIVSLKRCISVRDHDFWLCQENGQIIDCNRINISRSIARTFHCRIECKGGPRDCSRPLTIDTTMWKHLIPLEIAVGKVLNHLGWNDRLE